MLLRLTWSAQLQSASYQTFSQQYNQVVSADFASLTISGTGDTLRQAIAG
jgi:hypothetical protein